MYELLSAKCLLFLSDRNKIWIFGPVLENAQISNFMKIRPVGAKLFLRTNGRTDTTLTVAFRDFVNAPKYISTKWKWRNAANSDYECIYMPATWPACRAAESKGGTLNILNENIWFYALNKIWFSESNRSKFNKCDFVQNFCLHNPGAKKKKKNPRLRHCSR